LFFLYEYIDFFGGICYHTQVTLLFMVSVSENIFYICKDARILKKTYKGNIFFNNR